MLSGLRLDRRRGQEAGFGTSAYHLPEELVRRRYDRGLRNFLRLYGPLATTWRLYDNSESFTPKLIAAGGEGQEPEVHDRMIWNAITGEA